MILSTPRDILRDLARQVSEERLRQNLTQKELANRSKVGEATVRRLEKGQSVSLANYLRIASALGCMPSAADLIQREEPWSLEDVKPVLRERARGRRSSKKPTD